MRDFSKILSYMGAVLYKTDTYTIVVLIDLFIQASKGDTFHLQ